MNCKTFRELLNNSRNLVIRIIMENTNKKIYNKVVGEAVNIGFDDFLLFDQILEEFE